MDALPVFSQAKSKPPLVVQFGGANVFTSRPCHERGLFRQQIGDHGAFFLQFIDGRFNFRTTEFIDGNVLNNFKLLTVAADGERANQIFLNAIIAVRADTGAVPVAGRCRLDDGTDTVHDGVGRAGGAG